MLDTVILSLLLTADEYRPPHVDKHGRYVPAHHRSKPDHIKENNYGRYPNTNPYTGKRGKQ